MKHRLEGKNLSLIPYKTLLRMVKPQMCLRESQLQAQESQLQPRESQLQAQES